MTKKIIAFGASSSKQSINKQLATFAANQFQNVSVEILDLNDYEMPIFSVDKEKENDIPMRAHYLLSHVSGVAINGDVEGENSRKLGQLLLVHDRGNNHVLQICVNCACVCDS